MLNIVFPTQLLSVNPSVNYAFMVTLNGYSFEYFFMYQLAYDIGLYFNTMYML